MKVERAKLSWLERLYIPSILNGFKVTMRHFFSWNRSGVYADKQSDYSDKGTIKRKVFLGHCKRDHICCDVRILN